MYLAHKSLEYDLPPITEATTCCHKATYCLNATILSSTMSSKNTAVQ